LGSVYGGIKLHWLVGYAQAARERAEQTVGRATHRQSSAELKAFNALTKQSFACFEDAEAALAQLQRKLAVTALHDMHIVAVAHYQGNGRPGKNRMPDSIRYRFRDRNSAPKNPAKKLLYSCYQSTGRSPTWR
jgi:transposase